MTGILLSFVTLAENLFDNDGFWILDCTLNYSSEDHNICQSNQDEDTSFISVQALNFTDYSNGVLAHISVICNSPTVRFTEILLACKHE